MRIRLASGDVKDLFCNAEEQRKYLSPLHRAGRSECEQVSMGRPFKQHLNGPRVFSCSTCRCHISDHDDIISKSFQGRHGRAFLFSSVVNVTLGPKEERLLLTGLHTVADIYCTNCNTVLGWKYEQAFEEREKYKEGKFIVEKAKVLKEGSW